MLSAERVARTPDGESLIVTTCAERTLIDNSGDSNRLRPREARRFLLVACADYSRLRLASPVEGGCGFYDMYRTSSSAQ